MEVVLVSVATHGKGESGVATDVVAGPQAWRFVATSAVAMHGVVELWAAILAGIATDVTAEPHVCRLVAMSPFGVAMAAMGGV